MPLSDSRPDDDRLPRVLVVQDNEADRDTLHDRLREWGHEVVLAQDGLGAWSILQRERPPRLLIVDLAMPQMNAIEFCRRLRERDGGLYPYVLVTASLWEKEKAIKAIESGADGCFAKPLDPSELKAQITAARRVLQMQDNLMTANERLRVQATRDALTGLWNRATFLDLFGRELNRAARYHSPTGLLLLDLDNFKTINDTFGHLVGDAVLREAVSRLKAGVRSYDFLGRYGGEEFCIVLPGCAGNDLRERAESLRLAIANAVVRLGSAEIRVTVSIGATAACGGQESMLGALAVADVALYRAKRTGRNCSVFCGKLWSEMRQITETLADRCAGCDSCQLDAAIVRSRSPRPAIGAANRLLGVEPMSGRD